MIITCRRRPRLHTRTQLAGVRIRKEKKRTSRRLTAKIKGPYVKKVEHVNELLNQQRSNNIMHYEKSIFEKKATTGKALAVASPHAAPPQSSSIQMGGGEAERLVALVESARAGVGVRACLARWPGGVGCRFRRLYQT